MDEVRNYMKTDVISISSEESVYRASREMVAKKVGALLVVDVKKQPVGVVTDVDFNHKVIAAGQDVYRTKVVRIMSKPIITINVSQSMATALLLMHQNQVRHLMVADGDQIVGELSIKDFIAYYDDKFGKFAKKHSAPATAATN